MGDNAGAHDRRAGLGRHLPRHRRAAACANTPSRSGLTPPSRSMIAKIPRDLMNLVRHELGFSKTESRFPTKGTCLAIYSRCVNAETPIEQVLGSSFPWCAGWAAELKRVVRRLCRSQAAAERARLRRSAALLGADDVATGDWPTTSAAASTMCWSTNTRTPTGCSPRSCWRCKPGGRGLTVVGDDAQSIYSFRAATVRNILDFPDQFIAAAPTSSRSIATIARRSRSSPPPTP